MMTTGSRAMDELKEKEAPWGVLLLLGIFAYGAYLAIMRWRTLNGGID